MPAARQVVTRSPKRNVGLINCPWFQDRPIEHESRLEKHFVLRAMLFPGLKSIKHQPFSMTLLNHGKRYTPDFLLTFSNGERLVFEIKRAERIKQQKERLGEISQLCNEAGLRFFIVHQGQIEGQRRAERAALIRKYAMHDLAPALVQSVTEHVRQRKAGVSVQALKKKFGISQEQVFAMVAHRHIATNKELHLSDDDLLVSTSSEINDASIQFGSWFGCAPWFTAVGIHELGGWQQGAVPGSKNPTSASNETYDLLRGGNVQEDSTRHW
ncbi:TnsA endonuclease N-terminal domain-containing protein [Rhodoferax saidenbachensis]|uniref:TnsA endonuclease N-terminal domain-containing protein n=1 Tax=Rhodoferax saidenbachensis TaxID=1484693 RepID=A0ABU1ZRP1_9BURK|nr:TnsA endonuclease N-terminal domain-containing protein [Rhodoferax saidenbachensis]MDR7308225.1 hypothetical protein [Rhodoferax saidenbachensis]